MKYYISFILLIYQLTAFCCEDQKAEVDFHTEQSHLKIRLRNALEKKTNFKVDQWIAADVDPNILLPVSSKYSVGLRFPRGIPLLNYAVLNEVPLAYIEHLLKKGANPDSRGFPCNGFYEAMPIEYIQSQWKDVSPDYKTAVVATLVKYKARSANASMTTLVSACNKLLIAIDQKTRKIAQTGKSAVQIYDISTDPYTKKLKCADNNEE